MKNIMARSCLDRWRLQPFVGSANTAAAIEFRSGISGCPNENASMGINSASRFCFHFRRTPCIALTVLLTECMSVNTRKSICLARIKTENSTSWKLFLDGER